MPRVTVDKNYFRFNQGKITEASPLSFPENSMKDELNIDINFDGTIQRRKGIDYESGYTFQYVTQEIAPIGGPLAQTYVWQSVGDYTKPTPILVVRYGSTLQFYEAYEEPLSSALVYTMTIASLGITGDTYISFAEAKGYLFVACEGISPFYIYYSPNTNTFERVNITIKIRDLDGLPESIEDHIRPDSLTGIHRYNLLNQGWPYVTGRTINVPGGSRPFSYADTPIAFRNGLTRTSGGTIPPVYPSNSDVYQYYTVDGSGKGSLVESWLRTVPVPSSRAPKGKVIIEAFRENRKELSSEYSMKNTPVSPWVPLDYVERSTLKRPTCITFFQGHLLYAGVNDLEYNDKIYVSQSLTDVSRAGKCYSVNDPTADVDSSPLDTDGGVIRIEGVDRIISLQPLGSYCLVIANNGLWSISSSEGGFTVNSVVINKHSSIGGISNSSVTNYEGSVFFWSRAGIYMVSLDQQFETLTVNNITEQTIQRDYVAIPDKKKEYANPVIDTVNRRIYWLYNNNSEDEINCRMNRALILDTRVGAWYDYEIEAGDDLPFICAGYFKPGFTITSVTNNVVINGDNVVINGDQVVITSNNLSSSAAGGVIKYLTFKTNPDYQITFSEFSNRNFIDWEEETDTGIDYSSYIETGYELMEDSMRDMQATYIFCYFDRTEETFVPNGLGGLTFDFPSSCILQARWDWTNSGSANRWSEPQQVYRFRREFIPIIPGTPFDYDFDVIESKNKIRGKGKSLSLRFSSESNKDFRLLGWSIRYTAEQTP